MSVDSGWDTDVDDDAVEVRAARPVAPAPVEDDEPTPAITLAADLPADPWDDPDPSTADLTGIAVERLGDHIVDVVGVRLAAAGKVFWCEGGDAFGVGDSVVVEGERSTRVATVAVASTRRAVRERPARRILRRAEPAAAGGGGGGGGGDLLRLAKDRAAALRLPIKVFRVEHASPPGPGGRGGKVNLYYTSDERVELRELLRDLGTASGARIELRQVGARDEAKQVGGIGSCGQELCCTTWLPEFVPVSIKMAKDQGMVLSPTKVSGQCGRLKCCLVYEQATYAELRKGLPKLGKRVVTATGEGRVVEVDVIRQRVRVAFGPGESQVLPASEVRPLFPPQGKPGAAGPSDPDDDSADEPEPAVDGAAPPDDPDGAAPPHDPDGAAPPDDPSQV